MHSILCCICLWHASAHLHSNTLFYQYLNISAMKDQTFNPKQCTN
uniref:Uncharacterized protein n=1 Tax=Rhizophora mucronata TaxID=61149 RepID=A0A2P2NHP6_RHIMU